MGDIESLSHQVQRFIGNDPLRLPVVAGVGAGGTFALAIAAQLPAATAMGVAAIDPGAAVTLTAPLCTGSGRQVQADGTVYALQQRPMTTAIDVWFTPEAPAAGKEHVATLAKSWPAISVHTVSGAGLAAVMAPPAIATDASDRFAELPLTILDATPTQGAMAVIYSGDGWWRDLDRTIGQMLADQGMPTVGVDSLIYFCSLKTPEATAADRTAIIDTSAAKWGVPKVVLAGYSFGADILPATVLALDARHRAMIRQVSLLGLAERGDFEISVTGWLGVRTGNRQTLRKRPASLLCRAWGVIDRALLQNSALKRDFPLPH